MSKLAPLPPVPDCEGSCCHGRYVDPHTRAFIPDPIAARKKLRLWLAALPPLQLLPDETKEGN